MKYIGIDVGHRKCGVAVSDGSNTFATPLCVIPTQDIIAFIVKKYKELDAQGVVLGEPKILPKTATGVIDADANEIMKLVTSFGSMLHNNGCEVFYEPEWFSTFEANRLERTDDAKAAAIILQRFLERGL